MSTILTIVILLLVVAAIAWFATRANRERAARDRADAQRGAGSGGVPAHGSDATRVDGTAPGSPTARDITDANAAISRDVALADDYGPASASGTRRVLGESAITATGVGAAAAGAALAASPSAEGPDSATSFEDHHQDGITGTSNAPRRVDAVPGAPAPADTTPNSAGPALTEARAARLGVTAEPAAPGIGVDADEGHDATVARSGTGEAADPGTERDPDGPVAFSAPNVALDHTDGELRSQGSGFATPDVAPGSPGGADAAPSSNGNDRGTGSSALPGVAKVAAGMAVAATTVAGVAATARTFGSPSRSDAGTPDATDRDDLLDDASDGPSAPVAFSAPNVELKATDGDLRSQGSGRNVADDAPGMPASPGRPAGPEGATAPTGTSAGNWASRDATNVSADDVPAPFASTAADTPELVTTDPDARTTRGAGATGTASGDVDSWASRSAGTDDGPNEGSGGGPGAALDGHVAVRTGNPADDAREMIRLLNLRESDATRLDVTQAQFRALVEGRDDTAPSADALQALVVRLSGMTV